MSGIFTGSLKKPIPKTKTINGKKYQLEEVFFSEEPAKRLAKRIRAQGGRARVIEYSGYFAVYYN